MKKTYILLTAIFLLSLISCSKKNNEAGLSIPYEKYKLPNGLTVILNEDKSDPIVAVTIAYHVGSSREVPGRTGFAHLFEHMMFQESENLRRGQFVDNISNAGGDFNGGTGQDVTSYYEVIPKNALEMVLWMESDRMGYLENTVTKSNLANQQNVVQNEKRQGVDNAPYGFNESIILKNVFPKGHPYSWDVIGEMEDLTNATTDDVKAFHKKYYSPNNAFLVISGDIDKENVKLLVSKYFAEIPGGDKLEKRSPMPVSLSSVSRLFHEDYLAKAPQLTMVYPTPEQYSKDAYALDFLGDLLANSKKAPLYTILVKDKKLTSRVYARNGSQELAGTFRISVTANPGVNLTDVEKAVFEGFEKFEKEGFKEEDLMRIKAGYETRYYSRFASIRGKSSSLARFDMLTGDPEFFRKELAAYQAVTMQDVKNVFAKYIKGKNFVETSFVPKGQAALVVEGSVNAGIVEEDLASAAEVKIDNSSNEQIAKTPSGFDRSVMPPLGPDPEVAVPQPWTASLGNGIKVSGIFQNELPLVQYQIIMDGGHLADQVEKAGLANLTTSLMNEGTKNKTPEQLEDAIGLLGASIRVSSDNENISVYVSTLTRNFEKSVALVEEMLLEPRWDEEQFALAKNRTINGIRRNAASPEYLSTSTLNKLMFGSTILAIDASGTETSVGTITIEDLKDYYNKYFSPKNARILVTGDIAKERVLAAFEDLSQKWPARDIAMPEINVPAPPEKSQIYFVDVPGAKQSVIYIGYPSIPRTNADYFPAVVANYKLGDHDASISGLWMQIIREKKGFTYGAYSGFSGYRNYGYFNAYSKVRTNATLESLQIFRTEMEKYMTTMPEDYITFTKESMLKGYALRFETLSGLMDMLNTMTEYDLPADYISQEQSYIRNLTAEKQLEVAKKYINPARMYYVVAGDAKTQFADLEKVGFGKPVLVK